MKMENKEKITLEDMFTLAHKIDNWELDKDPRHETYKGSFGDFSAIIIPGDSKHYARMYAYFKGYQVGKAKDIRLEDVYRVVGKVYRARTQSVRVEAIKRIREMTRPEQQVHGSGLLALSLQDADTALTGENISVLGESDEYNLKNDSQLNTSVPLEELEDDINLDSFGSGSGLLDLSLQEDDTTLGGILDEIYTAEELVKEELPNILLKPDNTDNSKNKPKRHRRGPIRRLREIFWKI